MTFQAASLEIAAKYHFIRHTELLLLCILLCEKPREVLQRKKIVLFHAKDCSHKLRFHELAEKNFTVMSVKIYIELRW